MRLLRTESVSSGNDQTVRTKLRGKKKHKRLDAICEKTYNSCHRQVQLDNSKEFIDDGNNLELRRSSRTRRAPVLLDSSPFPPKKRHKVDGIGPSSIGKVGREGGPNDDSICSSSRDLSVQNGLWKSRLRFREKSACYSWPEKSDTFLRRKTKLFKDLRGFGDDLASQHNDKKEESVGKKSTVVKSKRPGRIKASNVLANDDHLIEFRSGVNDANKKDTFEVFQVLDGGEDEPEEVKVVARSDIVVENGTVSSNLGEKQEANAPKGSVIEENHGIINIDFGVENVGSTERSSDVVPKERDLVQVQCATGDQQKDDKFHDQTPEAETCEKLIEKDDGSNIADRKPHIKLGRRCGLCGGGTDGKPPKILMLDGIYSDNEEYIGSSASEEPSYDVWDGFGDETGWLGRLLGPINDRLGIAGIWVHQQCAVWSPEVYFAGLGCLKNIRAALYRGKMLKCNRCKRRGATIGCRVDRCPKTYHLPCARAKGCIFDHHKFLIACTDHRNLFQPHGIQNVQRVKKMKAKKMKLELRKMSNDAHRRDIEIEEKWLENCGEDEEFLKRENRRLHRDLLMMTPVYIGGPNSKTEMQYEGWESVAGLQHVIQCMKEVVILPLLYPEFFKSMGLPPPRGVLLHGYPGTGKTLVVRALVGSCARGGKQIAYFARKGADCLGKYVGDSERHLRLLFQVAEKSQPSIIFFDEIDGLAPCRTRHQDQTHSSVVSTLLALMDGLKSRGSVIVIGATNRPEAVDPALRRPGRFDREIYFPLPVEKDREAILSLHTRKWPKPITGSLLKWVAKRTVGFAGADLQALCTQAAIIALRRSFPLQKVLSFAQTAASHSKLPNIPTFSVEERDWLKAFSYAPPPCSRREGGIVVNDVASSPLGIYLVPCLLKPLTRLLILLYLDEHVWLPLPLYKTLASVKNVLVTALDRRRVQNHDWWLHVDDLLQEMIVTDEILKIFSIGNVLVEETLHENSNTKEADSDDAVSKFSPPNFQFQAAFPGGHTSHTTCDKSGFQILISGNPRCGQRHLASCLLHNFVGNIDVWKVDLAAISQEGRGDLVHGLTRVLMRCDGTNLCMIYMPKIDLWAIETCCEATESDHDLSLMEPQAHENMSFQDSDRTDMECKLCPSVEPVVKESQTTVKSVSYLWTLFTEQVESLRVKTPLIILATAELPLPLLPPRIRQFFGCDVFDKNFLRKPVHHMPQFYVQLDGNFDHDQVINSFTAKLLKELAQHFVMSIYGKHHIDEKLLENIDFDKVEGNANRVFPTRSSAVSQVPLLNRSVKGKSNLLLAISTMGYQILCYPHFAELCWVTSKLKEGPCSTVDVPFRGWPFNSCILRPISSVEKVVSASGSGNVRSKETGLVRGLISVGLSAYKGEYSSLLEVCLGVRKVLEILVARIDDKIQAGKVRSQFAHLLSQVAYLEDMIFSWAHALQSLEVDPRSSEAPKNVCPKSNDVLKGDACEGVSANPEVSCGVGPGSNLSGVQDEEIDTKKAIPLDSTDGFLNTDEEVANVCNEPQQVVVLDDSSPCKSCLPPEDAHSRFSMAEIAEVTADFHCNNVPSVSSNCSSPAKNSCDIQLDAHSTPSSKNVIVVSPDITCQANDVSPPDTLNNGLVGCGVNHDPKPSVFPSASVTCYYKCCPDCVSNLQNLLTQTIAHEWRHEQSALTVDDVHEFGSSLSANLHLTLVKLFQAKNSLGKTFDCKHKKHLKCPETEQGMIMECACHSDSKTAVFHENDSQTFDGPDSSFVFRDGVLINLDRGTDISYHCKFEKLCLCPLIEWLVMRKKPFG